MNKSNVKIFHQLKLYNNYNHIIIAGVLVIFGFLMLIGISVLTKRLLLSAIFFALAYLSYQTFKSTKPIIVDRKNIYLGKMVNGFKKTCINSDSIERIDLVHEIKTEFRPVAAVVGGDVDVHSNYYLIKLKDNRQIQFDNLYDEKLQNELKQWCLNNNIELDLDVKKRIKKNDD